MKLRSLAVATLVLLSILATAEFAQAADTDGDGLDDSWEIAHFGHLDWGAEDDVDHDGYTNLQEFTGGTDPTDPLDWPTPPVDDW
jgi:hypothetical protein